MNLRIGVGDKELSQRVLANKFYWRYLLLLADTPEGASFKNSLTKIVRKDRATRDLTSSQVFFRLPRPHRCNRPLGINSPMGFLVHRPVICFFWATRYWEMAIGVLSVQFGRVNSVAIPQSVYGLAVSCLKKKVHAELPRMGHLILLALAPSRHVKRTCKDCNPEPKVVTLSAGNSLINSVRCRLLNTLVIKMITCNSLLSGINFLQSRFLGRGSDETLFSEEKGFFSEKGGGIQ